jgi:penicillin-insensitive murein endopeptidase
VPGAPPLAGRRGGSSLLTPEFRLVSRNDPIVPIVRACALLLALSLALPAAPVSALGSQCYGKVSRGRIEGSVQLPARGANFAAYSRLGVGLGRTYVHSSVAEILVAAYAALRVQRPTTTYVYGETGWAAGGRIRPHRTHQNGLSVDFFVPVLDARGRSMPMPTDAGQRFGYDLEFDANAKSGVYRIDFPALAEHLYQLHRAAQARGAGIALVIFDTPYLPRLFATPRGAYLQRNLPFLKGKPWVRHDEHYHVDFAVPCKPEVD